MLFISGTNTYSLSIYSTVISTLSTTDTTCVTTSCTCTGMLNIKVENITNEDEG